MRTCNILPNLLNGRRATRRDRRTARLAGSAAVALMVIGAFVGMSAAPANAMNGFNTYTWTGRQYVLLQTFPCNPHSTYYNHPENPIFLVVNNCSVKGRLYAGYDGAGSTYCVSPNSQADFDYEFEVGSVWIGYETSNCS